MDQDQKHKPSKFTPDELRKYPGNENLPDQELEEQANTLLELSIILYNLYAAELSENSYEIGIIPEPITIGESNAVKRGQTSDTVDFMPL